jgi:hypothetical protein
MGRVGAVGMSFAQANVGSGHSQNTSLDSLGALHDGAEGRAGGARARISMPVARVVEYDDRLGIPR